MSSTSPPAESSASSALQVPNADGNGNTDRENDVAAQFKDFKKASDERNDEWRTLFDLEAEDPDHLVEDHDASFSRIVPVFGRVYISRARISFHATTVGFTTQVVLPFAEILSIEKAYTAYIWDTALSIETNDGATRTFGNFVNRDAVYTILMNLHRIHLKPGGGAATPLNSFSTPTPSAFKALSSSTTAIDPSNPAHRPPLPDTPRHSNRSISLLTRVSTGVNRASRSLSVPKISSPVAKKPKVARPTQCHHPHLKMSVTDGEVDMEPRALFELLAVSDFVTEFWTESGGITNIDTGPWSTSPLSLHPTSSEKATRAISYLKRLRFGGIGPSSTRCFIHEEAHMTKEGYTWLSVTRTPDVPYGSTFSVKSMTCVTWAPGTEEVPARSRIVVTTEVEWFGRCMMKGVIERSAVEGQKTYGASLLERITAYLDEHPDQKGTFVPGEDMPSPAGRVVDILATSTPPGTPMPAKAELPPTTEAGGKETKGSEERGEVNSDATLVDEPATIEETTTVSGREGQQGSGKRKSKLGGGGDGKAESLHTSESTHVEDLKHQQHRRRRSIIAVAQKVGKVARHPRSSWRASHSHSHSQSSQYSVDDSMRSEG